MKKYMTSVFLMVVNLAFSVHGADNNPCYTDEQSKQLRIEKTEAYKGLGEPTDEQASSYINWMAKQGHVLFGGAPLKQAENGSFRKMTNIEFADFLSGRDASAKKS